ncbi:MAG TPA: hypothetical protein VEM76_13175 [Anaeromyxobacteraceae bacterium]|nr:hypothetical protein [Anaeromyxobacteraceae bacterium]
MVAADLVGELEPPRCMAQHVRHAHQHGPGQDPGWHLARGARHQGRSSDVGLDAEGDAAEHTSETFPLKPRSHDDPQRHPTCHRRAEGHRAEPRPGDEPQPGSRARRRDLGVQVQPAEHVGVRPEKWLDPPVVRDLGCHEGVRDLDGRAVVDGAEWLGRATGSFPDARQIGASAAARGAAARSAGAHARTVSRLASIRSARPATSLVAGPSSRSST